MLRLDDEGRQRARRLIGRPRALVKRATLDAVPLLADRMDALAAELEQATTVDAAEAAVARWAEEHIADDEDLARRLWQADAQTHLAGQLFVRQVEMPRLRKLDSRFAPTFLELPFAEAIAYFESLDLLGPDELDDLLERERLRAFFMTRSVSRGMTRLAQTRIRQSFRGDGVTLGEFINELVDGVDADGYPGGARRYVENVFRTSTATSYNAGRLRQQTDPDVLAVTGAWEYLTSLDVRVRRSHAALHGKQWAVDDPDGRRAYPPNGYQCRCVVVSVEPEDVDPAAMAREVDVDAAVQEGFDGAPPGAIASDAERA